MGQLLTEHPGTLEGCAPVTRQPVDPKPWILNKYPEPRGDRPKATVRTARRENRLVYGILITKVAYQTANKWHGLRCSTAESDWHSVFYGQFRL